MSFYEPLRPFELHMPSRVLFGIKSVEKIGSEAKHLGAKNVLVVTDKGISKTGEPERIKSILLKEEMKAEIWDGVETEPSIGCVVDLRDYISKCGFDLLIGLGGGSCMDAAKAAAVLSRNEEDPEDYFAGGKREFARPGIPCITIPTTAGTGAEITWDAVIKDNGRYQGRIRAHIHHANSRYRRPNHVGEYAPETHRLHRHRRPESRH